MKLYSLYKVLDGKWEITLHIRENDDYQYRYEPRPDIRVLVDKNYNCEPHEMAKLLIDQVMHCDAVEVHTLSGHGFYMEKTNAGKTDTPSV
jgi:hypothetical protein